MTVDIFKTTSDVLLPLLDGAIAAKPGSEAQRSYIGAFLAQACKAAGMGYTTAKHEANVARVLEASRGKVDAVYCEDEIARSLGFARADLLKAGASASLEDARLEIFGTTLNATVADLHCRLLAELKPEQSRKRFPRPF